MGVSFSALFSRLWGKQAEVRVLILGLDNAGKTTILFKLKAPARSIRAMPTIGFNVETIVTENLTLNMWDLGGQTTIRPYWRQYYSNTMGIVYVVDSSDRERLELTRDELANMLQEQELKNAVLLVFANKQDAAGCLTETEISTALGLGQIKDRQWRLQKSIAVKNEGVTEGLMWLSETIAKR